MNQWIVKHCSKLNQLYKPPFYSVNGHLQTWLATQWPKSPKSMNIRNQSQIIDTLYYEHIVLDWFWIEYHKQTKLTNTQLNDHRILTSNHQKRILLEESLSVSHIIVIIPGWLTTMTSSHVTSLSIEMVNYFQQFDKTQKNNCGNGFKCVVINPPTGLLQSQQSHQNQHQNANHNSFLVNGDGTRSNYTWNQDNQYQLPTSQQYSRHLHEVLRHIRNKYPNAYISAVSISLGYSLLLSYLSDIGASTLISAAVCISPSYDLEEVLTNLASNLPYDILLRHNIKRSIVNNHRKVRQQLNHQLQSSATQIDENSKYYNKTLNLNPDFQFDKYTNSNYYHQEQQGNNGKNQETKPLRSKTIPTLLKCKTVREVYCHLYGIPLNHDYENQSEPHDTLQSNDKNCWEFINPMSDIDEICIPVLCLNAKDDPITDCKLIPNTLFDQHPTFISAITKYGGHAGFLTESQMRSWSSQVAVEFIITVQNYNIKLLYGSRNDQDSENDSSNLI
ncbi:Protein ABHD15 [Trichoplax sp. H2]|nr:Protein ABHD15 [Trichoplax sp. H2]|eukprot:RDD41115.1 Protein ABHD15 [Trichoplax sp. H2]